MGRLQGLPILFVCLAGTIRPEAIVLQGPDEELFGEPINAFSETVLIYAKTNKMEIPVGIDYD